MLRRAMFKPILKGHQRLNCDLRKLRIDEAHVPREEGNYTLIDIVGQCRVVMLRKICLEDIRYAIYAKVSRGTPCPANFGTAQ